MMYVASGENFLKMDEVGKKPAMSFLNFMNFYKRKTELDNIRINAKFGNNS